MTKIECERKKFKELSEKLENAYKRKEILLNSLDGYSCSEKSCKQNARIMNAVKFLENQIRILNKKRFNC